MKWLDRGTLTLLVFGVLVLAYIESKGGVRRFFADHSANRLGTIDLGTLGRAGGPPTASPSDGFADPAQLLANPIAASEGANGTFIPPMSATANGAVKITANDLGDPSNRGRYFRDPDKGLVFVALPDDLRKLAPAQHRDDGSRHGVDADAAYPNVLDYFRAFITPKRIGPPPQFPVSF